MNILRFIARPLTILIFMTSYFVASAPAIARTVSVDVQPPQAVISIYPDTAQFNFEEAKLYIKYRFAGSTEWIRTETQKEPDGTRTGVVVGYGMHEVRVYRERAFRDVVQYRTRVYIPSKEPSNAEFLAKKYAPILVFNESEETYPVKLQRLFDHSNYINDRVLVSRPSISPHANISLSQLGSFLTKNVGEKNKIETLWVSQHCANDETSCPHPLRDARGSATRTPIYWHVSREGDSLYISYYLFYGFDYKDGTWSAPGIAAHVFDRESVTIRLTASNNKFQPVSVTYGAHVDNQELVYLGDEQPSNQSNDDGILSWTNGRITALWNDAIKAGTHPVVYMARGSHGIFPTQGWYRVINSRYTDNFVTNLDEEAGSARNSNISVPGSNEYEMIKLPLNGNSVLNYSGEVVRLVDLTGAKFPPFTGRLPATGWVLNSENLFSACNSNADCRQLRSLHTPRGLSELRMVTVIFNETTTSFSRNSILELRTSASNGGEVLYSTNIYNESTATLFTKYNTQEYEIYINNMLCGQFNGDEAGWNQDSTNLREYEITCELSDATPTVGRIDLTSGPTVSNSNPELGERFSINFSLRETAGAPRTFDRLQVHILNAAGAYLYTIDDDPNFPPSQPVTLTANEPRNFSTSTFLDPARGRTAGTYRAQVMFEVDGGGLQPLQGNGNPVSFTVSDATPTVGQVSLTSGPTLSNRTPRIDEIFEISFTLTESAGVSFRLDRLQVHILDAAGRYLYTIEDDPRLPPLSPVTISAGTSRPFTVKTYLASAFGRQPGTYRAQVMIEVAGGGLGPISGSSNPISFNAR